MAAGREVSYLTQVLRMDPREQSLRILATRRAFLNQEDDSPILVENDEDSRGRRREVMQQRVDALRRDFWSLEEAALAERLRTIDAASFPDLSLAIERMKSVAERRHALRRLERHAHCFPAFLERFQELSVAAPREAADLRARFLAAASHDEDGSLRDYRRVARTVEREFPELAVLEEHLLGQMSGSGRAAVVGENAPLNAKQLAIVAAVFIPAIYLVGKLVWSFVR